MSQANRVCPVALSGMLDSRLRRMVQNPAKILAPFIREGMTVLDLGCGPGFFTIDMAQLVGTTGRVLAVDLQQGMLARLAAKISSSGLAERVVLHPCRENGLELPAEVRFNFILAFYVVHEIPEKAALFAELAWHLADNGRILLVEPPLHVSPKEFRAMLSAAAQCGLRLTGRPRVFLSKTALLAKPDVPASQAKKTEDFLLR